RIQQYVGYIAVEDFQLIRLFRPPKLLRLYVDYRHNRSDLRTGSPADVIRITFAQFARKAVCFLGVTRLAKCHRGFVQRARSDGRIVVKQGDAFESFAGVSEVPAL